MATRLSARRRVQALLGLGVALAVVAAWLWIRRERAWSIALMPAEATASPWSAVELTAAVIPEQADTGGWSWRWSAPTADIEGTGPTVRFRGRAAGEYVVKVTVRSARGTERSAEATITVQVPPFRVGIGPRAPIVEPDKDPFPDILRPDLPFRIVRVTVDKPEVCRGERTVIHVEAQDDGGNADQLVPTIGGKVGWAAAVIVPGEAPGQYKIPVRLGDPDRGDRAKPLADFVQTGAFVTLKDCDAPRSLWVNATQPTSVEEDARFHATILSNGSLDAGAAPQPAAYRWDFGDGSPAATSKGPDATHLYPNEEQRGPGKRVFTYLVKAEALDASGKVLLDGVVDIYMRNRLEELKLSDHRIQLLAVFHPEPATDADGARFIDVVLKNLDAKETASLTSLAFVQVPCTPTPAPPTSESHAVAEVFRDASIGPRGSIAGRLRWPMDGSPEVCHVDVSVEGTSQPGGFAVGGQFSMRVGSDHGVETVADPDQAAAIGKAMAILHKTYVTPEDLERLVASGEIPASALKKGAPAAASP